MARAPGGKAAGILVFPSLSRGGIGVGGEYGEGAPLIGGKNVGYCNIVSDSIGFVCSSKGLMYFLTFEGSKITKSEK